MDKKWNLQDIKPAPSKKRRTSSEGRQNAAESAPTEEAVTESTAPPASGSTKKKQPSRSKERRFGVVSIIVATVVIIAGFFVYSYLSSGAEVSVHPRTQTPSVDAEITAYQEPQTGELAYEVMTLEADGERQVSATGQEQVDEQATGSLLITKSTPESQRLIKNTRFETADGLIYRTTETAVVPGSVDGRPGEVEAAVFADETGEAYNNPSGTLTVPGLESDSSLFDAITATVADPINGGFSGQRFIIDEAELETAQQALRTELEGALLERVANEKPAGFTTFDNSIAVTYQSLPSEESGENLATINERALLQVPLFKNEQFAAAVAQAALPEYENMPVRIADTSELSFVYTSSTTTSTNIENVNEITFAISGMPQIIWVYDGESLANDLQGKQKTALPSILGAYPAIEKAEAVLRPFWKRTFPDTPEEITVTEVIGS